MTGESMNTTNNTTTTTSQENPGILQTIPPLQHDRRIHEYYKQYHHYNMTGESMNTTNNTTTTT